MSMFDQKVRILSEGLARTIDRRKFLKTTGATMFAGFAALAAGQSLVGKAAASSIGTGKEQVLIQCAPPGPYCNTRNPAVDTSGCHGANCFQHMVSGQIYQCEVYYQYYQAGCWTTPVSGGYWTCCDCRCPQSPGQATCGCAQFSTSPIPRPDSPGGKANG